MPTPTEQLRALILKHVPVDGSTISNGQLRKILAKETGRDVDEKHYAAVRDALVNEGVLARGPGRGGSIRLAESRADEDDDNVKVQAGTEEEEDAEGGAPTDKLRALILKHVPVDGSTIPNGRLRKLLARETGRDVDEDYYAAVRDALVDEGVLARGPGRGGSMRLAESRAGEDDEVQAGTEEEEDAAGDEGTEEGDEEAEESNATGDGFRLASPSAEPDAKRRGPKRVGGARAKGSEPEPSAVLSYRHGDRRKNNPEVGMVTPYSDPEQPKTGWRYDPHIDPTLQFDIGRSEVEKVIDDALAAGTDDAMRAALTQLKRQAEPYLAWTGKAERTSFDVDTVSLHVHERVDPLSILSAARDKVQGEKKASGAPSAVMQLGLFSAPFENLPLRDAIDFYRHDRGWANRLIAGDSLLVMNSLIQKESMAGQVQMVYIDPPYGIAYGSNFQPFVGKRDVKDRNDADLTQEPETIKAFRDTWELGVHSFLTYLRDRLFLAKSLLHTTGSCFVQISDENLHHVREIMDEVFGAENFVSVISFQTKIPLRNKYLANVNDYIVWYGIDFRSGNGSMKFNKLFTPQDVSEAAQFSLIELPTGEVTSFSGRDASEGRVLTSLDLSSSGATESCIFDYDFEGATYSPTAGKSWKTNQTGMERLAKAGRLYGPKSALRYRLYHEDYPVSTLTNSWTDTVGVSGKIYVVQTDVKAIERCLLMTTDPGDLVFDPTCGGGTTGFAAEKWGRRWITCDTSRVAITLAKQRLLTASYDYYELRHPKDGLRGGFLYETAPHITLGSISNNPGIDEAWAQWNPRVVELLNQLNESLRSNGCPAYEVSNGGRSRGVVDFSASPKSTAKTRSGHEVAKNALMEWEVPFEFPAAWPSGSRAAFDAFRQAVGDRMHAMHDTIGAHAGHEVLYDKPRQSTSKVRITGPFTVEAVPFPTVLSLDESPVTAEADATVARSGESSRQYQWRDELLRTGVRGKGGQRLMFASLDTLPDTRHLHATGHLKDTGERVVVSFGPEYAALEQRQVEMAMQEAGDLFPRPKMIVFCAFAFDPEAAKDIDQTKGIVALKVQMNTDLLTEDLKKARSSNQSFWLMGQPEVSVRERKDGTYEVEVHGFDYFDTVKGTLVSGGKAKIALWMLDTNYDERSMFPRQVFFPMAGDKDGWDKLRITIRAQLDEDKLKAFHGTVSLPFEAGDNKKVAVKIIDDRGIESLKVLRLD